MHLKKLLSGGTAFLFYLSLVKLIIHLLTLKNYGYFGDEFYYLAASSHLDLGYVDMPPLATYLLALSRLIFGDSQPALHIFPAIAGAFTIFFTGMLAREMGGGRYAQFLSALISLCSPFLIALNSYFTYDPFDQMMSVIFFYRAVRLLKRENMREWIIFGIVAGVGIMTKLTMIFLFFGFIITLAITSYRKCFLTIRPYLAGVISIILCTPFMIWQYTHDFPLFQYWHNYSSQSLHPLPWQTLFEQIMYLNFFSFPVVIMGLYYLIFVREEKYHLPMGLFYPVLFIFLSVLLRLEAREIMSACIPAIAGGAVFMERKISGTRSAWLNPALCTGIVIFSLSSIPRILPVFPFNIMERYYKSAGIINLSIKQESPDSWTEVPFIFGFRLGWVEMVQSIAEIYSSLPESDRGNYIIYASNYEEAGAVDQLGKSFGLPGAICNHLTYQFWGPGEKKGEVTIAFGKRFNKEFLLKIFEEVSRVATINNDRNAVGFEKRVPVFLCRKPKKSLKEIWPSLAYFY
jgi:hypothetical protein